MSSTCSLKDYLANALMMKMQFSWSNLWKPSRGQFCIMLLVAHRDKSEVTGTGSPCWNPSVHFWLGSKSRHAQVGTRNDFSVDDYKGWHIYEGGHGHFVYIQSSVKMTWANSPHWAIHRESSTLHHVVSGFLLLVWSRDTLLSTSSIFCEHWAERDRHLEPAFLKFVPSFASCSCSALRPQNERCRPW